MAKAPEWLSADIQEVYAACQGNIRAIQRAIREKRGVDLAYMTISDRLKRLGLARPRDQRKHVPKETPTSIDTEPEVLPGQMSIEDADTAGEVHHGAVHEYDALPDGYAKVIQPMREYTDAEEFALNESMRLFGFVGAIVRDQYGRILDGNQRQRVARLRGLGVPHTITHVRDDAHATAIATSLNAVRRQYPRAEREQIALVMRDNGFTYEAIAEALGVGKATVYRDVMGVLRIRAEQIVPHETIPPVNHVDIVPHETIEQQDHEQIVPHETIPVASREPSPSVKRIQRKGGGTYPAQRPTGTKPKTSKAFDAQQVEERIKDLYMEWLRRCEDEAALLRADTFLNTLRTLAEGRAKLVLQGE